jgi:GNAT superfamily N-acetyltransferase
MTIRTATEADIPAIARVHVESWQWAYRGMLPQAYLDGLSHQKHVERHQRLWHNLGSFRLVAELADAGIVGFLHGGRERTSDPDHIGEIYAVYLLENHHRLGLGTALIRAWATELRRSGINSALVWALAANHRAAAFYQKCGAKKLRDQPLDIAGVTVSEIAWGWDDLRPLSEWDHTSRL